MSGNFDVKEALTRLPHTVQSILLRVCGMGVSGRCGVHDRLWAGGAGALCRLCERYACGVAELCRVNGHAPTITYIHSPRAGHTRGVACAVFVVQWSTSSNAVNAVSE